MKQMKLTRISTRAPENLEKDKIKKKTDDLIERIAELQPILYAQRKYSLLIVLQGMDASGKDGVVKEVFTGVNPMGCRVHSFKAPTQEELSYDFLWRVHKQVPARGMIQIFNRSHYEDVLITRVHGWINDKVAKQRFEMINSFEKLLESNDTQILKFYLHISPEEQAERFADRRKDPRKKWKYNQKDLGESKFWNEYQDVYEDVFQNCSADIPWEIVPSDQNWYKEYLVAKRITAALEQLDLKYPKLEKE